MSCHTLCNHSKISNWLSRRYRNMNNHKSVTLIIYRYFHYKRTLIKRHLNANWCQDYWLRKSAEFLCVFREIYRDRWANEFWPREKWGELHFCALPALPYSRGQTRSLADLDRFPSKNTGTLATQAKLKSTSLVFSNSLVISSLVRCSLFRMFSQMGSCLSAPFESPKISRGRPSKP